MRGEVEEAPCTGRVWFWAPWIAHISAHKAVTFSETMQEQATVTSSPIKQATRLFRQQRL